MTGAKGDVIKVREPALVMTIVVEELLKRLNRRTDVLEDAAVIRDSVELSHPGQGVDLFVERDRIAVVRVLRCHDVL